MRSVPRMRFPTGLADPSAAVSSAAAPVAAAAVAAAPVAAASIAAASILVTGLGAHAVAQERELDSVSVAALVDGYFETEMAEAHIPGGVFLMVKDGEVLYAAGYGYANLEDRIPVDPERTVFRVGSNSKTLTAAAVLTLVEDGVVDLDADVNRYLSRVRVPDGHGEPVTLRHLLTHTAGFDERLFGQHVAPGREPLSLADYLAARLPPRTGPPGRVISYNDHGTSLAGLVVEDVSGRPFADYVHARIFEPLGMVGSTFDVANPRAEIMARLATAYRYRDGEHLPYEYDVIQTAPAAGLLTTASDMGRFLSALLGGGQVDGRRILGDSMTAVMLDRQFAHSPLLRGRAFGFVEYDENGIRGLDKDGQATGFLSRIFLIPEAGVGFFASINLSIFEPGPSFNRASRFHRGLTSAILDEFFPADPERGGTPAAPEPDPAFDASTYVGTYRAMEGSRHTIEKILFLGNETFVRDGGDGTLLVGGARWVEIEPGQFQYADGGPTYLAFGFDDEGRASHLFIGGGALERAPWHDTMRTTARVLAGVGGLLLTGLLIWPLAGPVGRWRGRRRERRGPSGGTLEVTPHPGRGALIAASATGLAFLVGFGWAFSQIDFQQFFKGIPPVIAALLALPLVTAVLTVLALKSSMRAWRRGLGSLAGRLYYSVVLVGLVAFLMFLNNWHMLGWRY